MLECKTIDRIGKLNAAIALLLNAHAGKNKTIITPKKKEFIVNKITIADPNNIDYEMAVNSMKTINELMPNFIKGIQFYHI